MKQVINPEYGSVAFGDRSTGGVFVTRSTLAGRFERRHGGTA